jgi:hypothetical protein
MSRFSSSPSLRRFAQQGYNVPRLVPSYVIGRLKQLNHKIHAACVQFWHSQFLRRATT